MAEAIRSVVIAGKGLLRWPGGEKRRHLGLLQTMGRQRGVLSYRAIRQSRLGMALLHA